MNQRILTGWKPEHSELFSEKTLQIRHSLHTSPLFSKENLAQLIETYPRANYNLHTMSRANHDLKSWREGDIGDRSGHEVLQAIEKGRLWINLRNVSEIVPEFGEMVDQMFEEFEEHVPGLQTFRRTMGILISSPKVQVYYHVDIPGQMLWQIEGRKRVYVYQPTKTFLPQQDFEDVVLNRIDDLKIRYEQWFDEYADVREIGPGDMLYWPLNSPHRVENLDCLNISVTTEHFTPELRRSYAVNYANGLLRKGLNMHSLSQRLSGVGCFSKMALAGVHKFSGMQKRLADERVIDFEIDPHAEQGLRDIQSFKFQSQSVDGVRGLKRIKNAFAT